MTKHSPTSSDEPDFTLYSGQTENWRTLFDLIPDAAFITTFEDGRILAANHAAERIYGFSLDQMIDTTTVELGIFRSIEERQQAIGEIGQAASYEQELVFWRSGKVRCIGSFSIQRVQYRGQECLFILGRDVTAIRETEQELRESESRYRILVEGTSDIPWQTDAAGRFIYVGIAVSALGFEPESLLGEDAAILFGEEGVGLLRQSSGEQGRHIPSHLPRPRVQLADINGDLHWFDISFAEMHDHFGGVVGYQGIARDVSLQVQRELELEVLTFTDELTQLSNRRGFLKELEDILASDRSEREKMALIFIDLDDFKLVNDQYGHEVGDRCLVRIADSIRSSMRPDDFLARYGGDEFAALVCCIDEAEARTICDRILRTIAAKRRTEPTYYLGVGVSMGVTFLGGDTVQSAIARADQAMYKAKKAGKGQCYIAREDD